MKKNLRKEIIAIRKSLDSNTVAKYSDKVYAHLLSLHYLNRPNTLIYMDFRNEVATKKMIEAIIEQTGSVLLPKVTGDHLTIHRIHSLDTLTLSSYGILEPANDSEKVPYDTINLILAPGVAFDETGYRLGYGGGYYDRLLSQKRKEVPVIALAFECQIIEKVPTEPHDFKMDMIVTEARVIKPKAL